MIKKIMQVSLVMALIWSVGSYLPGAQAKELAGKQELRIAQARADLDSLDAHRATAGQGKCTADLIYNGLVRFKPGDIRTFEPDLAQSIPEPKIVNGKQIWTFQLRKGIMVHPFPGYPDGYELTSEDIVFSYDKVCNPKLSAFSGTYPKGMIVKAIDKYTVDISLDVPLSPLLFLPKVADLEGGFIVPKKAYEKIGTEAFGTHGVGTGPFMFERYEPGIQTVVKRHEKYFRGAPILERVYVKYMKEPSSRELGVKTGEIDVAELSREQDAVNRVEKYGVPVMTWTPGSAGSLHFNTSVKPMDSLKVRKALSYALDRKDNLLYYGKVADPIYSLVPTIMPGGLSEEDVKGIEGVDYVLKRDLAKAKALLKEAGYPDGFSLKVVTSPHRNYQPNYEIAQSQLAKIGVKLDIKMVDHSTMHSMTRKNLNPIVVYSCPRPNADIYLTQFFYSSSIVVSGKKPVTNFSHFNKVDDLIDGARAETNPEKQIALWKAAQIQTLKDAVTYPLYYLKYVYAINPYVDFGYEFKSTFAQYPQVTEATKILKK